MHIIVVNRMVHAYGRVLSEGPYTGYSYVQLTGVGRVIAGLVKLSFEHDGFKWCYSGEAKKLDLTHETAQALPVLDLVSHTLAQ